MVSLPPMIEGSRRAVAVLGLGSALAVLALLGGCGEKDEPATTGPVVAQTTTGTATGQTTTAATTTSQDPGQTDRQLATQAAFRFLTSPDAASVCDSGVTAALLQRAYGDRAGCLAARKPQSLAESARLSEINVGQGIAKLTARAKGGVYGSGQTLKMSLVRDGTGTWRVDKAQSNVPIGP